MKDLRRQMTEDMKLRALAEGTQTTYLEAIKNLAKHYNCPPDQLSEQQVKDFIVHLTKSKGLDNSTVRVHFYAIKFLYQRTLNKQWRSLELIRIKRTKKLPTVLTVQEVWDILNRVRRPVARMSLIMMYSCGLRVSESNL